MRIAAYLSLAVGLALLGFGIWLLYARFVGGPDHYMGRPDGALLRELDEGIAAARASRAESEQKAAELRDHLDKAGGKVPEDLRTKTHKLIEVHEERAKTAAEVLAKAEPLREKLAQQHDAEMDEARDRTLRRGILFTLVGLIWVVRTADYLRRTARRTPATPVGA